MEPIFPSIQISISGIIVSRQLPCMLVEAGVSGSGVGGSGTETGSGIISSLLL